MVGVRDEQVKTISHEYLVPYQPPKEKRKGGGWWL